MLQNSVLGMSNSSNNINESSVFGGTGGSNGVNKHKDSAGVNKKQSSRTSFFGVNSGVEVNSPFSVSSKQSPAEQRKRLEFVFARPPSRFSNLKDNQNYSHSVNDEIPHSKNNNCNNLPYPSPNEPINNPSSFTFDHFQHKHIQSSFNSNVHENKLEKSANFMKEEEENSSEEKEGRQ